MSIFNGTDWACLATLFDGVPAEPYRHGVPPVGSYPGFRPTVREAPNGDTRECPACKGARVSRYVPCGECHGTGRVPNVDTEKRFLHVAPKYSPPAWAMAYLARAHYEACRVAEALGVPASYYPRVADGTLRVLDYPPGAGTVEHTDFDLFTIVLYRSHPGDLHRTRTGYHYETRLTELDTVSPGLHIGEIGELVGLGPATPHRVPARPYAQQSIVYFAMPDHAARLPCDACGGTGLRDRGDCGACASRGFMAVGEWLKERMARSRY